MNFIKQICLTLLLMISQQLEAQFNSTQNFFDGADTSSFMSLSIQLDTSNANNIWQIGQPSKTLFNATSTVPNALMTDTVNFYPDSNISRFVIIPFDTTYSYYPTGTIGAIRWVQKLDFEASLDGGMVEFSIDSGQTWQNAFNNPYVYSYYGYDLANVDTLPTGEIVFTGTDTLFRDIWLCFDRNWASINSLTLRFSFLSDSIPSMKEGWLIDNLLTQVTFIHTANKTAEEQPQMRIYPNPVANILNIELARVASAQIIEQLELLNVIGQPLQTWENLPAKFHVSLQNYPNGLYFMRVKSNLETKTLPFIIQHD